MAAAQDVTAAIVAQLIEAMEQGPDKWRMTWQTSHLGMPVNHISNKGYNGINLLLLYFYGMGYKSNRWLTYKQAESAGGNVKKGEKGYNVVFWNFFDKKDKDGKIVTNSKGEIEKVAFMKKYTVFNVEQCENIEYETKEIVLNENERIENCEKIVSQYITENNIKVNNENISNRAAYSPITDSIEMPVIGQFDSSEAYYATFFHEMIHSTGHETRLNRKLFNGFGSEDYAKEELVAELGAIFLCAYAGIVNKSIQDNAASYLKGWVTKAKEEPKYLLNAASSASKAVDFIVKSSPEEVTED